MLAQLKRAEVDTVNDPGKLELIGLGRKAPAQPTNPSSQPRNRIPHHCCQKSRNQRSRQHGRGGAVNGDGKQKLLEWI